MNIGFHCAPCEDGFEVSIHGPLGASFWIEYWASGTGGYQELGEITGRIDSDPMIAHQQVRVAVIEVGIVALSLGEQAISRRRARPERKLAPREGCPNVPRAAVEVARPR